MLGHVKVITPLIFQVPDKCFNTEFCILSPTCTFYNFKNIQKCILMFQDTEGCTELGFVFVT